MKFTRSFIEKLVMFSSWSGSHTANKRDEKKLGFSN